MRAWVRTSLPTPTMHCGSDPAGQAGRQCASPSSRQAPGGSAEGPCAPVQVRTLSPVLLSNTYGCNSPVAESYFNCWADVFKKAPAHVSSSFSQLHTALGGDEAQRLGLGGVAESGSALHFAQCDCTCCTWVFSL